MFPNNRFTEAYSLGRMTFTRLIILKCILIISMILHATFVRNVIHSEHFVMEIHLAWRSVKYLLIAVPECALKVKWVSEIVNHITNTKPQSINYLKRSTIIVSCKSMSFAVIVRHRLISHESSPYAECSTSLYFVHVCLLHYQRAV